MRIALLILMFAFVFQCFSQENDTARTTKTNYQQGIFMSINVPAYPSKIGYFLAFEHSLHLHSQYDFSVGMSPSIAYGRSWNIGTSLHQSILIGKKIKYKIQLSEDLYFNTLALSSKAETYQPWDRPGKYVIYTSLSTGVEFPLISNTLYLTPMIGGGFGHGPRDLSTGETNIFKWFFYGTFILGIDLKISL